MKTHRINIRFTEKEKETVDKRATALNLNSSEYIRKLINSDIYNTKQSPKYTDIIDENLTKKVMKIENEINNLIRKENNKINVNFKFINKIIKKKVKLCQLFKLNR